VEIEDQVVRHVDVNGSAVAWSSIGSGSPLVIGGWWSSHLELNWADPAFRAYIGQLARHHRVIRYDRPGTGASDRNAALPSDLEEEYAVLSALIDSIGLESVNLLAGSSGCAVASLYAARHPSRTSALVLYGGFARGEDIAAPAAREALLSVVASHWGLGSRVLADIFLPDASTEDREAFVLFQRRWASREQAVASLRTTYTFDATDHLTQITSPTLVLHRRDDRAIPFALGRELAARIPEATFVALDGADHFPWRGDAHAVTDAVISFLGGSVDPRPSRKNPSAEALSPRELEVLALVAQGRTDAGIAEQLVLSTHTVHRHVANVRTKLGVSSRAAAAAWATSAGVI
jgi:pimeloyl-ACP methyl ester carboxylesterase/DNA-binding CsgD family transcriptional regulator